MTVPRSNAWHRIGLLAACAVAICTIWASPSQAAEPIAITSILPEETALVVRLPGGAAFVDAMRQQTRLGAALFNTSRWAGLFGVVNETANADERQKFLDELARFQLKPADALTLFDGELGFALAPIPRGEKPALVVGITWMEPGADLVDRLWAAIQQGVEEQAQDEHPIKRVDLDLAGQPVMHLAFPVTASAAEFQSLIEGLDPNSDNFQEELEQRVAQRQAEAEAAGEVQVDQVNVFVVRLGDRLVIVNTFPMETVSMSEELRREVDFGELSGEEAASGLLARFLTAHESGQATGSRFDNTPELDRAVPGGVPLIELIGDPRPLWAMAAAAGDPRIPKVISALGVDTIGPLAIRIALDGTILRSGMFLAAPAPRTGLLTLLDQEAMQPEPPDWVPASIVGFQQFNFDLGQAYLRIKEILTAEMGPQVAQGFEAIETQLRGFLQATPDELLSSIGKRHTSVAFAPKAGNEPADISSPLAGMSSRSGMVWQLKDEALWQRMMNLIKGFIPLTGGAVASAQEQGFDGFRLEQPGVEVGLFLGRGYLVLGIGSEVTETLLAALRNPPRGEEALRGSQLMRDADALIDFEPCLGFQIGDEAGTAKLVKDVLVALLDMPGFLGSEEFIDESDESAEDGAAAEDDESTSRLLARLKELLPTDQELEGAMGVSASVSVVTPEGLETRSAITLPAP